MGILVSKAIPTNVGVDAPKNCYIYLEMNFKRKGHIAVHGWLYSSKEAAIDKSISNLHPSIPILPRMDIADLSQEQLGGDNPTVIAFIHEQYKAKVLEAVAAYNEGAEQGETFALTASNLTIDL